MEHLFKVWPDFSAAVNAAPHVLLLADYDGTMAHIVGRPEEAVLSKEVRKTLSILAKNQFYSVGVISGRSINETKSKVAIEGIYYSGNHGLEIEGPGLKFLHPRAAAARAVMNDLAAQLAEALETIDGVIVQQKGLSVSVHYRLSRPEDTDAVAAEVKRVTAPHAAR